MSIITRYNTRADAVNSLLCVGLDSQIERLPKSFRQDDLPQFSFNRWIIEQTAEYAAAFKANIAFYEACGQQGLHELHLTIDYLRQHYPDIFTICDAKRADIGSTNQAYAQAIFDQMGFDAITLHPYLGREALEPFLSRADKGCIVLCRTSNPGAREFQDLETGGKPLWLVVAEQVSREWDVKHNCMLVVGATYPEEMRRIRQAVGEMTFLVPGIGAQGGDIEATIHAGLNASGKGLIVNASRSIIFAGNPAEAARSLRDDINAHR
ncbi:MAG: orotidine-5'-phosphate decarboxylase [Chloroflexi bacterium]|nr:orotidine-5'-phosphate decarboxylase [Chloroflexota bacterium]